MPNSTHPGYMAFVEERNEIVVGFDCKEIQALGKDELLRLQEKLGLGSEWGEITVPKEWLAAGAMRAANKVKLAVRGAASFSPKEQEAGIIALTRFALLLFLVPVFASRSRCHLSPSTVLSYIRRLSPLVHIALRRPTDFGFFSRLRAEDLLGLSGQKGIAVVLDHMRTYQKHGYWNDVPKMEGDSVDEKPRSAHARFGNKSPPNVWLPLPDRFVAEAGWRFLWIIQNMGPAILSCAEELADVYARSPWPRPSPAKAQSAQRAALAKEYLRTYRWIGADGKQVDALPFVLKYPRVKGETRNREGLPQYLRDLLRLLDVLQSAHMFIFLLCSGARASETAGLQARSIFEQEGKANVVGTTFKPSSSYEGERKDWPLPPPVVSALRQQERLASVAVRLLPKGKSDDGLKFDDLSMFLSVSSGRGLRNDANVKLNRAIESLQLEDELAESSLHVHRFRKTLARLGALAIIGAPKIFMDLFGHENIDVTLGYMLSDPLLRAEMQEVRRAEVIMFAERAIASADENGGPAAAKVKKAVDAERARLGSGFGEQSIRSLAETFTLGGETWQLVRPGVVCTKTPLQVGPCAKRVAQPEPSRCRASCEHRLEEAALRDDVDGAIAEAVGYLKEEEMAGNSFMVEMWEGQILHSLKRFPKLQKKWIADAVVASVLARNQEGA